MKRVKARKKLSTAQKITALSEVGIVLLTALAESRLVHFIAQTACDLTGAAFAAFSLQPPNNEDQAPVPSEGKLFHLAAVVGVTDEQAALFRHLLYVYALLVARSSPSSGSWLPGSGDGGSDCRRVDAAPEDGHAHHW